MCLGRVHLRRGPRTAWHTLLLAAMPKIEPSKSMLVVQILESHAMRAASRTPRDGPIDGIERGQESAPLTCSSGEDKFRSDVQHTCSLRATHGCVNARGWLGWVRPPRRQLDAAVRKLDGCLAVVDGDDEVAMTRKIFSKSLVLTPGVAARREEHDGQTSRRARAPLWA